MNKKAIKSFVHRNERTLSGGALLLGFIVDTFTLSRVDLLFDNLILFTYLFLATVSILLINRFPSRKFTTWLPYLMQYAFGGLFSGYIIFYTQSATLTGSWLFILLLILLFWGNEKFKKRYEKTTFQISILFIALFSFLIFFIPVVMGKMGALIFLLSGVLSLVIIRLFIGLLNVVSYKIADKRHSRLKVSITVIYLAFNLLYFTNLIPPIPLALKDLGIYHNVEVTSGGQFVAQKETRPWYEFYKTEELHWVEDTPLYAYSAVFAPTRLNTRISHQWSYFDDERTRWVTSSRISFSISGGRDGGYRGYTFKRALTEGLWRVDVLTERDQLIGRKIFRIILSDTEVSLEEVVK